MGLHVALPIECTRQAESVEQGASVLRERENLIFDLKQLENEERQINAGV